MQTSEKAHLDARKAELRSTAKQRRDIAENNTAAEAISAVVQDAMSLPGNAVISAYWPMGSEIDPRPLMRRLHETGHRLCLPVVAGKGQPLIFRAWQPGDLLESGGFGTQIPAVGQPTLEPQVLFVPLLAYDRDGYRLGYGGGFYDRTLAKLRAGAKLRTETIAVGLAYAAQEVPRVPRDQHDQRLDWIVTEAEVIEIL